MKTSEAAADHFRCANDAPTNAWKVVIFFYAAATAVTRHRFQERQPADTFKHPERFAHVRTSLPAAGAAYGTLYSLAHNARYAPGALPMDDSDVAEAKACAETVCKACGVSLPPGSASPPAASSSS